MKIESILIQPTLEKRADLLSDPLDPGNHRESDEMRSAGPELNFAWNANLNHVRRHQRSLSPTDLDTDVYVTQARERSDTDEGILKTLPSGIHNADVANDLAASDVGQECCAHLPVANSTSGYHYGVEIR